MSKCLFDAFREYIFSQERVFGMRITFTDSEIWDWLEILERLCDPCTDEDVKDYERLVKKLKDAKVRSYASAGKILHIRFAQDKKQREHDNEVRESFSKALRESKQQVKQE